MGNTCQTKQSNQALQFTVLSLNYCGISASPFEFYVTQYQPQLQSIGKIFHQLCEKELQGYRGNNDLRKIFGNLELKFKKGRYSPLFEKDAGFIKKSSECYGVTSAQQFNGLWNKWFDEHYNKNEDFRKVCSKEEDLQRSKRNVRKYDFLMLKALLKYVYRDKSFEECIKGDFNFQRYFRVIQPFFEFTFLDEDSKLSMFKYGYIKTNPDVYFVIEYAEVIKKFFNTKGKKNYKYFCDKDQMIILKNNSFIGEGQFKPFSVQKVVNIKENIEKPQDKTPRKVLAIESKNYIIISIHLTSREEINIEQVKYLTLLLKQLSINQDYKNKTVIMGGDVNSFQSNFPSGYDFYPKEANQITTYKKRTAMQAQKKKINESVKKSSDKIITNKKILEGSITMIDGSKPDHYQEKEYKKIMQMYKQKPFESEGLKSTVKTMLPCDAHPFDQFLVKTIIQVPDFTFSPSQDESEDNK